MAQMWEAHKEIYVLKEPVKEIVCAEEAIAWMVESPRLPNVKTVLHGLDWAISLPHSPQNHPSHHAFSPTPDPRPCLWTMDKQKITSFSLPLSSARFSLAFSSCTAFSWSHASTLGCFGWMDWAWSEKGLVPLCDLMKEVWCCSQTTHFTK